MESYQFSPANAGQPEEIRVKLPFEDEQNKEEIFQILEKLKTNEGSVNDSDITLFCRLLSSRTSLKYVHDEALTAQVLIFIILSYFITNPLNHAVHLCPV